ncbi:hypothetical protein DB346_16670 [Verrucomicrobia bacterium LW23]|nr:hypothetical protein DB346_16670 [Verrucomicrobia bacterium LW23]
MPPTSPIDPFSKVRLLRTYSTEQLAREWRDYFQIDVTEEFRDCPEIRKYLCENSGLAFFTPPQAEGSRALYNALSAFDWYYMTDKWEYDVAARLLSPGRRVLEVGCGAGAFVRQAARRTGSATGLEINPRTEEVAGVEGVTIRRQMLADFLAQAPERARDDAAAGPFDVVCSFQVLEHIAQPMDFLRDCVRAVKPGGRLLLGTPNASGFLRRSHNLLDLPPHHMGHWNARAFRYLQHILPVRLDALHYEPLAPYHVDYYLDTMAAHYTARKSSRALLYKGPARTAFRFLLANGMRRLFRGQSMLACYTRTG